MQVRAPERRSGLRGTTDALASRSQMTAPASIRAQTTWHRADEHARSPRSERRATFGSSRPSAGAHGSSGRSRSRTRRPARRGRAGPPSRDGSRRAASATPSFRKIEWANFSTDGSVITSDAAIAALFFPCAISSSVSRSRGVSSSSGDSLRARAATRASTTFGSITEPPPATSRIAPASCAASPTRSLRRYARRSAPFSSNASAYSGAANWLRTTTPVSGFVSRRRSATWMPSSWLVGGIRMSVKTTSGCSASIASSSDGKVFARRNDFDVRLGLE